MKRQTTLIRVAVGVSIAAALVYTLAAAGESATAAAVAGTLPAGGASTRAGTGAAAGGQSGGAPTGRCDAARGQWGVVHYLRPAQWHLRRSEGERRCLRTWCG